MSDAMFQSTRPRGARPRTILCPVTQHLCFNPRARAGRDSSAEIARGLITAFQSTRPRGARPVRRLISSHVSPSFNPRARAGRDMAAQPAPEAAVRFQSTRPRGARLRPAVGDSRQGTVSIHAPARGATTTWSRCAPATWCFNPRARAGRDARSLPGGDPPKGFQSTRPRGARPPRQRPGHQQRKVSIHAPARGATFARHQGRSAFNVSIHAPARGATTWRIRSWRA